MTLYADGKGAMEKELDELWTKFVPLNKKSAYVQGEMLRVVRVLANQFYRDGNLGWEGLEDEWREITEWFGKQLDDEKVFRKSTRNKIRKDIELVIRCGVAGKGVQLADDYEDVYDRLTTRAIEWCLFHNRPLKMKKKLPI